MISSADWDEIWSVIIIFFIYRGGKYSEDDAKAVIFQILSVISFCHLQGVVHRDLKPEVVAIIKLKFKEYSYSCGERYAENGYVMYLLLFRV